MPPPPLLAPPLVAGYRVGRCLGAGSFGVVHEGARLSDGTPVALKFLPRVRGSTLGDIGLLTNEVNALSELHHPHVIALLESVKLEHSVVLVMELARGGDLRSHLEAQPGGALPPPVARAFVKQLARGVRFAHSKRIIHRDLKLDNVLLADAARERVCIADFGLAQVCQGHKLGASGSLYYMVRPHAPPTPHPAPYPPTPLFAPRPYLTPPPGAPAHARRRPSCSRAARATARRWTCGRWA